MEVLQNKSAGRKSPEPPPPPARKTRKQPKKLDLSRFEHCSLMYLQIGEVVLWNNAEAMRKNGNCPGEVALTLCQDFGVQLDDLRKPKRRKNPRVNNEEIFQYFAKLTAPCGSPSILDQHGGLA